MVASFAGAWQRAPFAADAFTGKGLLMVAILTSTLNQRHEDIKAELCLRLLQQIAGSPFQIIGNMVVERLCRRYNSRGYL
jgi:hypothetical protein